MGFCTVCGSLVPPSRHSCPSCGGRAKDALAARLLDSEARPASSDASYAHRQAAGPRASSDKWSLKYLAKRSSSSTALSSSFAPPACSSSSSRAPAAASGSSSSALLSRRGAVRSPSSRDDPSPRSGPAGSSSSSNNNSGSVPLLGHVDDDMSAELSGVFGCVLSPHDRWECVACAAEFHAEETVYPDPRARQGARGDAGDKQGQDPYKDVFYCRECFAENFSKGACAACSQAVLSDAPFTTHADSGQVWHASCFVCAYCGAGQEEPVVDFAGKPSCESCFDQGAYRRPPPPPPAAVAVRSPRAALATTPSSGTSRGSSSSRGSTPAPPTRWGGSAGVRSGLGAKDELEKQHQPWSWRRDRENDKHKPAWEELGQRLRGSGLAAGNGGGNAEASSSAAAISTSPRPQATPKQAVSPVDRSPVKSIFPQAHLSAPASASPSRVDIPSTAPRVSPRRERGNFAWHHNQQPSSERTAHARERSVSPVKRPVAALASPTKSFGTPQQLSTPQKLAGKLTPPSTSTLLDKTPVASSPAATCAAPPSSAASKRVADIVARLNANTSSPSLSLVSPSPSRTSTTDVGASWRSKSSPAVPTMSKLSQSASPSKTTQLERPKAFPSLSSPAVSLHRDAKQSSSRVWPPGSSSAQSSSASSSPPKASPLFSSASPHRHIVSSSPVRFADAAAPRRSQASASPSVSVQRNINPSPTPADPPAEQVCDRCHAALLAGEEYIKLDGDKASSTFHPHCFTCHKCAIPIEGGRYVDFERAFWHPQCAPPPKPELQSRSQELQHQHEPERESISCNSCRLLITAGEEACATRGGKRFHQHCLRCAKCDGVFAGQNTPRGVIEIDGRFWHLGCAPEKQVSTPASVAIPFKTSHRSLATLASPPKPFVAKENVAPSPSATPPQMWARRTRPMPTLGGLIVCAYCSVRASERETVAGPLGKRYHLKCLKCAGCGVKVDSDARVDAQARPHCESCLRSSPLARRSLGARFALLPSS